MSKWSAMQAKCTVIITRSLILILWFLVFKGSFSVSAEQYADMAVVICTLKGQFGGELWKTSPWGSRCFEKIINLTPPPHFIFENEMILWGGLVCLECWVPAERYSRRGWIEISQENEGLWTYFGPYSKVREEPFKGLSMEIRITKHFNE